MLKLFYNYAYFLLQKKKVLQKIKSEISNLDQKEKELSLHKQNQNEKLKVNIIA